VIFTCTWYTDTSDLRFLQCIETLKSASEKSIPIVVVDGSPSDAVHNALSKTGAIVRKQIVPGGKGAALREAAAIAAKVAGVTDETLLCWQEPEKTHMVALWNTVPKHPVTNDGDVFVPRREEESFRSSYPIEQFYSESYGNLYLDALMKDGIQNTSMTMPWADDYIRRGTSIIDWHFGPFAFRAKHLGLWTKYTGNSYDAQLVPIVHAIRRGFQVCSFGVDFSLDTGMKNAEEANVNFIEKRLNQLNDLDPKVKAAWTDEPYY
jgi:hypothetical protein